ncbi:hypothetical protein [Sphingomonas sp. TREG-RG-20F-R18-01]|uniref:hypothetical protein n=1 Tax=Sphingomonas sp. TREG-RG-20F-R18-01 TaxID=2914982 RepID=UPI001F58767F|nr:hypothetical protein [Sphingomonas sp. TREG-RG-20F-R18-01]
MTYHPKSEFLWRIDPAVEAARKLPDWGPFHRECGKLNVFFDHIEKQSKAFAASAFTLKRHPTGFEHIHLADGRGLTVIAALEDAYQKSGRVVPAALPHLDRMAGRETPFADLLGDPFEDLLG